MKPEDYDAVEIHRCVECMDAGMNRYMEQVDDEHEIPEEAAGVPFWSVFLHHDPERSQGRGVVCVADCTVPEHADVIAEALRLWIAAD